MSEIIRHSSSTVDKADFRYIRQLAQENYVGHGTLCDELERRLAKRFSRTGVVLAGSGEGALALSLQQLHRQRPDRNEVIVSSYVCSAIVNAILSQGLQPVFADVVSGAMNLGLGDVAQHRLTEKTLVILCTHMGGFADDVNAAMQLGVPVISDCAQAIGSVLGGRSLLSLGDIAVTSFGPTKFMTAGLGGAVLCDEQDHDFIRRLAMPELSVAEYRERGFVRTLGQHFSDLNAGLALAQLDHVDIFVKKRRLIAQKYDKVLSFVPGLILPGKIAGAEPNWFRYYFFSHQAHEWQQRLQAMGVDARTSISHVMTDYFPGVGLRIELARQAAQVVSLPIYPGLKPAQITQVVEALQCVAVQIAEQP